MATTTVLREADSPTRDRAFVPDEPDNHQYSPDNYQYEPEPRKVDFCQPSKSLVAQTSRKRSNPTNTYFTTKRRNSEDKNGRRLGSSHSTYTTSMQVPPSPRNYSAAPMPSFMTVYHEEATSTSDVGEVVDHHAYESDKGNPEDRTETGFSSINAPFALFHQQRDSTSTSASESSDSSPTTTISTLDSSSITEPSPGTDSPKNSASPISHSMDALMFRPPPKTPSDPQKQPFFQMERPTTPAKKARNLKNLAVNTTSAYNLGRAVMSAPFTVPAAKGPNESSEPSSPSFVKPPTPPRRKLALGLSIQTPANNTLPRIGIPPTPSMVRPNTLRHFQSSPSLPLCTPGHAPMGGMTLPPPRLRKPAPRGFADIPLEDEEEEAEQNFDVPQSQEMKPDSYPNGPIRIYESGVDLYFEPDRHVASKYDVIMNVASEVKNPFTVDNGGTLPTNLLQPSTSFGIIAEDSEATSSPDTPKATPISAQLPAALSLLPTSAASNQPEYIHIPWEHNTDIVPDLPRLVRLIDDRVKQGKSVLVHCQCGVSRSASLIVAYGLYKNPGLSVQEAYDAVKKRSKWIGPNMNLIMQLQEFRSGLLRNSRRDNAYQAEHFAMPRKSSSNLSSASTSGSFDVASGSISGPATPRTAPLAPERQSPDSRARSGSLGPFSAAPVEQGEGSFWDAGFRRSWGSGPASSGIDLNRVSIVSDTPWVDPMGHVVPMVTVIQHEASNTTTSDVQPQDTFKESLQDQKLDRIKSLKRKTPNFSRQLPLRRDYDMDTSMVDPPSFQIPDPISPRADQFHMVGIEKAHAPNPDDSFGILSPFATEFPRDSFGSSFGKTISATPPKELNGFSPTTTIPPKEHTGFAFFSSDWKATESTELKSPNTAKFNLGPERNDSLHPTRMPSNGSCSSPLKALRTKYSSPSLQDSKRLLAMQDEIEASLPSPKRHFDDLDALMSPRVVEFTVNPWDELLSVKPVKPQSGQPTTPTSSKVDPRSPVQHGISPIVRNIFDVL